MVLYSSLGFDFPATCLFFAAIISSCQVLTRRWLRRKSNKNISFIIFVLQVFHQKGKKFSIFVRNESFAAGEPLKKIPPILYFWAEIYYSFSTRKKCREVEISSLWLEKSSNDCVTNFFDQLFWRQFFGAKFFRPDSTWWWHESKSTSEVFLLEGDSTILSLF